MEAMEALAGFDNSHHGQALSRPNWQARTDELEVPSSLEPRLQRRAPPRIVSCDWTVNRFISLALFLRGVVSFGFFGIKDLVTTDTYTIITQEHQTRTLTVSIRS